MMPIVFFPLLFIFPAATTKEILPYFIHFEFSLKQKVKKLWKFTKQFARGLSVNLIPAKRANFFNNLILYMVLSRIVDTPSKIYKYVLMFYANFS